MKNILGEDWIKGVKGVREVWLYWFGDFVFQENEPYLRQERLLIGFNDKNVVVDTAFESNF